MPWVRARAHPALLPAASARPRGMRLAPLTVRPRGRSAFQFNQTTRAHMSLFTPIVRSPRGRLRSGRWRTLGRNSRPRLESLEDRVVPSVVDLTTLGSSGTINGAIYRQGQVAPSGTGNIQSFIRIQRSGTE